MGSINTHTIVLRDWEGCLDATTDNAAALASAESLKVSLQDYLVQGKALKARQDSLVGTKQRITQELNVVIKNGKEAARRLRLAVKAAIGTDNEQLVQFNVAPRRPRGPKKVTVKPPPVGTPEVQVPGTPAVPTKAGA